MRNIVDIPAEEEAVEEEVASNNEESDNETAEFVQVEIDTDIHGEISPFVKEVTSDEFRDAIEQYWTSNDSSWIEVARKVGVDNIQQKCFLLGFKPQTAYVAVIYLTRYLSRTREAEVNVSEADYSVSIMEVMSVACLSLSAKMEEVVVPTLSSFSVIPHTFNKDAVVKMELSLLKTLEWKMSLITPFAFTGLFEEKLNVIFATEIVSSRVEYAIMRSIKDVKTLAYRPSVVALAATLVAVNDDSEITLPHLRLGIRPLVTELDMDINEVSVCYTRIREMVAPPGTGHVGRRRVYQTAVARGQEMERTHYYTKKL